MDAIAAIKVSLETADMVGMAYLADLSDAELMERPHPGCNHINWQLGHLICSEHQMISSLAADAMPALPTGFDAKYSKESAGSDDPSQFVPKEELLEAYRAQRAGTLAVLAASTPDQLDEPTGVSYAPTRGAMLLMQANHWLMHCGQWVIVRRSHGKPIAI